MEYTVINNKDKQRFELHLDGKTAYVQYKMIEGGVSYLSTVVPPEFRGKGVAGILVKHVLDDAAANNLKVEPICPYIKSYIDKHPEYQANSLFHK